MRTWPIELRPVGLVTCGATAWRHRGRLRVSAIVKATFAFAPEGPMRRIAADALHAGEAHHDGDPNRSLAAASDLDPYKAKTDVTVTGHAYAPASTGVFGGAARIALTRGEVLLDSTIHVIGSRPPGASSPVERVPLVYERALGGIGFADNPVGTDGAPGVPPPVLVDPANRQRPIGFGPIARSWPVRARLLGALPARALDAPIAELPDDFDWSFFQAAPPDQRIPHLQGSEWLLLEGLHPTIRSLRTQLPSARGLGRVHRAGGFDTLTLVADTLHVDTDRACCSVVWRAPIEVDREDDLRGIVVDLGVESAGELVAWPAPRPTAPPRGALTKGPIPEGTIEITPGEIEVVHPAPRERFGETLVMTAKPRDPEAFAGTMILSPDDAVTMGPQAAPNPGPALPAQFTMGPQAAPNPGPALPAQFTMGPQAAPNQMAPQAPRPAPAPSPRAPSREHDFERTADLSAFALTPGRAPNWLDLAGTAGRAASKEAEAGPPAAATPHLPALDQRPSEETLQLSGEGAAALLSLKAPFDIAAPGSSTRSHADPIAGAPWSPVRAVPSSPPISGFDRTLADTDESPDEPPPAASPPEPAAPPPEIDKAPPPETEKAPPPAPAKPAEPAAPAWSWAPQVESQAPAEPRNQRPPPPAVTESLYNRFSKRR